MKVEWIRISTRMFENRKIKRILRQENGPQMVYVWIRLLVIAGNLNDEGRVYFCEEEPYTVETLAEEMEIDEAIVDQAISLFKHFKMIADDLTVLNWERYQNSEGLERMREKNRIRNQEYRARKKEADNVTDLSRDVTVTSCVTSHDGLEKRRKEKKREEYINIVSYLNKVTGASYKATTKSTQSLIKARMNEGYTEQDFFTVIDKKWAEWKDSPNMVPYMRPSTLFGTKFEGYLNAPVKKESVKQANVDAYEAFIEADQERARRGNGV